MDHMENISELDIQQHIKLHMHIYQDLIKILKLEREFYKEKQLVMSVAQGMQLGHIFTMK